MAAVFLSAQQVADRLGVHPRTVHRYVREGRLAASKVGNRYRISPTEVRAFLGGDADSSTLEAAPAARADVTVEMWDVAPKQADRIRALVLGAADGRPRRTPRLEVHITHEPDALHLQVTIRGSLEQASAVLALLVVAQES